MAGNTEIEWTECTWNPVTGCSKYSPGCAHCYAERMAMRLHAMGQPNYKNGFKVTLQEHVLDAPLRWKKPRMIFVNSMSDMFHKEVPFSYIEKVFEVIRATPQHQYQLLTKRADRLRKDAPKLKWPHNLWMGVTVENKDYTHRIADLRTTKARVKFLSMEPLLGPAPGMDLTGIDWIIVGGESGPGARTMKEEWALDIRDQCRAAGVAFFFKQWGGVNKKANGRTLRGKLYEEMPEIPTALGF